MSAKERSINRKDLTQKVIGGKKYYCEKDNIGEGRMGKVTLAYDTNDNVYAIKKLKDPENESVFLESGKAMTHLSNGGLKYLVNTVYAGKENNGDCYIVMQAMKQNLAQVIEGFTKKKKLTKKELSLAYTYSYKLFQSLDELHQQTFNKKKVTHNDFIPSNVLVSGNELKLTDLLVIPKGMNKDDFEASMAKSSILNLAKEGAQVNLRHLGYLTRESPSIKRDIYMAGIMATELLTGGEGDKVASMGINEFNKKNKSEIVKESIEAIIHKTTRTLAKERSTTKEVIKVFETTFGKGVSKPNSYFVMLNDGSISRPADRYLIQLSETLRNSDNGAFSIEKLNQEKKSLEFFVNEIDDVDADERLEMEDYHRQFEQEIKKKTEKLVDLKKEDISKIQAEMRVKSEENELEKQNIHKLVSIDYSIDIDGKDEFLKRITKNIEDQKESYNRSHQQYLTGKSDEQKEIDEEIEEMMTLISLIDKEKK
jgi:serine/threonine protein kinase